MSYKNKYNFIIRQLWHLKERQEKGGENKEIPLVIIYNDS